MAVTESPGKQGGIDASAVFAPVVDLLDLPQFSGGDAAGFARCAVYARPWRTVALSSSPATEGYATRVLLDRPARIGSLVAALGAGVSGRFDRSQAMEVDLAYGGFSSAPELSVLNGANRFAVMSGNGIWEVAAFIEAEEIAAGRWWLRGLLRGLAGTEDAVAAGAAAGAPFVMLDDAVQPLGLAGGEMGLALNWIAEAAGASGMAGPFSFAGGLRAETPLSPVHIRASRGPDGSAAFTWIRRGRVDADNWTAADIPLDEPEERYRVEVLDGASVLRQAEVTAPSWTYPAADELADFGARQLQLKVRISQMGQKVPLGIPAVASIAF